MNLHKTDRNLTTEVHHKNISIVLQKKHCNSNNSNSNAIIIRNNNLVLCCVM